MNELLINYNTPALMLGGGLVTCLLLYLVGYLKGQLEIIKKQVNKKDDIY